MPRRGWHVSEDLSRAVWQEILRGPRPPAARWPPAQGSRQRQRSQGVRESMQDRRDSIRGRGSVQGRRNSVQGRRGSTGGRRQDGVANPTRQEGRGLPPDEVMANARARVSKLEAAIAAVGDSDSTCATLREALARAKSQAQERPVADRINHTNIFIERAKKRVNTFQEDVKIAQAAVVVAQEKLAKEEVLLREGEGRLQALQQEEANGMDCQEVPPTVPCNFAQELAQLRACVVELQTERTTSAPSCRIQAIARTGSASSPGRSLHQLSIWFR